MVKYEQRAKNLRENKKANENLTKTEREKKTTSSIK